ncbi:MAG: iron ABC transporter permease [Thiobacillaceae bacterium]|nr:iron ABC transporter permease [Thiobacillaceae bacterium]MCX7673883.1 iron ABC transporter permease [Thiobacillaceae bacterium]MDW8323313.1 iron ABC transporter permease [Burkholderiales bacterium]
MRRRYPVLLASAIALALIVSLPVVSVIVQVFRPDEQGVWAHLAETVLTEYVVNSLLLAVGTGLGAALLGTGAAWWVAMYRFPGRGVLEWALLLPLAMPTYVIAYAYTDFLQYAGPLQSGLRAAFGWERGDYWFPDVRSLPGAIVIFSLVFYPYVYVLARAAFLDRSGTLMEAARGLGLTQRQAFWRVGLPLARPAVAGGVALVVMETLAEFGAVSYFGVNTFTTGIYRAWYAFGDPVAASQLSASLLALVLVALVLEKASRGRARFHDTGGRPYVTPSLPPARAALVWLGCLVPLAGGFLLPALLLLRLAWGEGDAQLGGKYLTLAANSLTLAGLASAAAIVAALLLAYAGRLHPGRVMAAVKRVASLGYAVPGTVIAVGALIPLTALDHALIAWLREAYGVNPGLVITGTAVALVFAYLARFLAVALNATEAALARIRPSLDEAARSLGATQTRLLLRVHVPLLTGGLLSGALLVFVDVMKELPATIVLRPFNYETLATQVFILAADERLAEAATPSLAIVAVGLIPVILLSRSMRRR